MVCDTESLMANGLGGAELAKRVGWTYSTVAATGSDITDCAKVQTKLAVVTAGNGSKGCMIPTTDVGELFIIKNAESSALLVYPLSTSDGFNAAGGGTSVSIAATSALIGIRISDTDVIAVEATAA